jgi:hypothetical protein
MHGPGSKHEVAQKLIIEETGRLMFCAEHDYILSGENMEQNDGVEIACRDDNYMNGFGDGKINGIMIIMCVRPCISSANHY